MCAVICAVIKQPSLEDLKTLQRVFCESMIRGMHATGISFISNKIVTIKDTVPADIFVQRHLTIDALKGMINADGTLYLIGHCRYSTSDLEFNQPISNDFVSVVHNGVISQHDPETWESLYGYKCKGKNDTELLLHSLKDQSPLVHWKDASLSVVELYANKSVRFYRNGKRPIYFTSIENGYIITSTENIAHRAGLDNSTEVPMNTYMTIDSKVSISFDRIISNNIDLQQVDYEIETVSI